MFNLISVSYRYSLTCNNAEYVSKSAALMIKCLKREDQGSPFDIEHLTDTLVVVHASEDPAQCKRSLAIASIFEDDNLNNVLQLERSTDVSTQTGEDFN